MVTFWDDKYHTNGACWDIPPTTTAEKGRSLLLRGAPCEDICFSTCVVVPDPRPYLPMATHLTVQLLLGGEEDQCLASLPSWFEYSTAPQS